MPKKKGSDNYDALGSIFDFIFAEAEKKPDRRKPVKLTGVDGRSMLTDSLAAALEAPGAFISNNVVDEFNNALDYDIKTYNFGEFGKVSISTNSLVEILKDPKGTVEKAVAKNKAIRSTSKVKYLGGGLSELIYSGWAHKYGNLEAKSAIYGASLAGETLKKDRERNVIAGAIGQAKVGKLIKSDAYEFIPSRAAELARRKIFSDTEWGLVTQQDKRDFTRILATSGNLSSDLLPIVSKYSTTANPAADRIKSYVSVNGEKTSLIDPKAYLKLEQDNIESKIKSLEILGVRSQEQEEELGIYRKTKYLLDRNRGKLNTELSRIKTDLKYITDKDARKALETELKDTRAALRALNQTGLISKLGKAEGYFNSLNMVYGPNVITSILKGDFFDANKNTIYCPTKKLKVNFKGAEIETFVRNDYTNPLLKAHAAMGTSLYYATPRSLFRTLFYNGEGFVHILSEKMKREKDVLALLKSSGYDSEMDSTGLVAFVLQNDYKSFIEALKKKTGVSMSLSDMDKIEKLLSSNSGIKRLLTISSTAARIQKKISDTIGGFIERRLAPLRAGFAKIFLEKFVAKYGASELLEHWIAKGSINALAKTLATSIAGALGIVATPLGSIVVAALTWVATDLIMKTLAEALIIGKYVLLGMLGLIVLVIFIATGSVSKLNKTTYSANLTPPGDVMQCSLYEVVPLDPNGPSPWGPAIITPPSGEECPLGTSSIRCNQGWVDNVSSHRNITQLMPIDLGYVGELKAPQFCTQGDCKIVSAGVVNCRDNSNAGGSVIFAASTGSVTYTFTTYHVKPVVPVGQKVMSGETYAVVQLPPEVEVGDCWTGPHLHLEAKQDGVPVDPLKLLQGFNCSVPDEDGCL